MIRRHAADLGGKHEIGVVAPCHAPVRGLGPLGVRRQAERAAQPLHLAVDEVEGPALALDGRRDGHGQVVPVDLSRDRQGVGPEVADHPEGLAPRHQVGDPVRQIGMQRRHRLAQRGRRVFPVGIRGKERVVLTHLGQEPPVGEGVTDRRADRRGATGRLCVLPGLGHVRAGPPPDRVLDETRQYHGRSRRQQADRGEQKIEKALRKGHGHPLTRRALCPLPTMPEETLTDG